MELKDQSGDGINEQKSMINEQKFQIPENKCFEENAKIGNNDWTNPIKKVKPKGASCAKKMNLNPGITVISSSTKTQKQADYNNKHNSLNNTASNIAKTYAKGQSLAKSSHPNITKKENTRNSKPICESASLKAHEEGQKTICPINKKIKQGPCENEKGSSKLEPPNSKVEEILNIEDNSNSLKSERAEIESKEQQKDAPKDEKENFNLSATTDSLPTKPIENQKILSNEHEENPLHDTKTFPTDSQKDQPSKPDEFENRSKKCKKKKIDQSISLQKQPNNKNDGNVEKKKLPLGLINFKNTCYRNSVLQSLFHAQKLYELFQKNELSSKGIFESLMTLWEMNKTAQKAAELKNFICDFSRELTSNLLDKLNPVFDNENQHDALEFHKVLLECLSHELNRQKNERRDYQRLIFDTTKNEDANGQIWYEYMRGRESSTITDLFSGQLFNQIECNGEKCREEKKKSRSFEEFWDLSLSFPKKHLMQLNSPVKEENKKKKQKGKNRKNPKNKNNNKNNRDDYQSHQNNQSKCFVSFEEKCKLEDMIKQYLNDENNMFCDFCDEEVLHSSTSKILRLPEILVIHFKRFKRTNSGFTKINSTVEFPKDDLDIKEFVGGSHCSVKDTKYKLFALISHTGTLDSGHYTSECFNQEYQSWFKFNDIHVDKLADINVSRSDVYMLYYIKKSCL